MITKQEAMTAREFHDERLCKQAGLDANKHSVREFRNGATKTWKRDPDRWEIPVKFGMYGPYGRITNEDAHLYHTRENCPTCQ